MFSRSRTPKPEPTPEELGETALIPLELGGSSTASQPARAAAGRYRACEYWSVHGSHPTDSYGRLLTCTYKNGWRWEH